MGCHSFLQGIFLTQGSNSGLPNCRWILYRLSHQGSPRILEWVAYPFSRGTFWPRNRTGVSCIAAGFFTIWITMEVPPEYIWYHIRICVPISDLLHPLAPGQRIMSYFPMSGPSLGFPGCSVVKNLPAEQETWVWSLSWEDPLVFLLGKSHEQRAMVHGVTKSQTGMSDQAATAAVPVYTWYLVRVQNYWMNNFFLNKMKGGMVPKFHWDYSEWQVKANWGEKCVEVNKSCFSSRIFPALSASGTFESPSPTPGCWDIDWQQHC